MKKQNKYAAAISAAALFVIALLVSSAICADAPPLNAQKSKTDAPSISSSPAFKSDSFAKGSRFWSITGGVSHDLSDLGQTYLTQFNAGYYMIDGVAIYGGGEFGYENGKRTKGGVLGGPEIGLRWHFIKSKKWSIFAEGLAGAVFQQQPITEQSLRFNFDLQSGGGVTYRLGQKTIIQSGFRWHHLSNARIRGKEHNLGYDGPMAYIGVLRSF